VNPRAVRVDSAAVRLRSPYDREILRLALPALGALAAEPLYVLADTAIVGHLGRPQIAALGLAGTILSGAFTIFNFLTYGTDGAHAAAVRMVAWSVGVGAAFAVVLLPLGRWIPRALTGDHAVIHDAELIWPLFALMQPLAGAVFALDGILIGASDTAFLMWSMLASSCLVFIPIALLSLAFGWGIVGVWSGLVALIAARLVFLRTRFAGRRWAVIGWD